MQETFSSHCLLSNFSHLFAFHNSNSCAPITCFSSSVTAHTHTHTQGHTHTNSTHAYTHHHEDFIQWIQYVQTTGNIYITTHLLCINNLRLLMYWRETCQVHEVTKHLLGGSKWVCFFNTDQDSTSWQASLLIIKINILTSITMVSQENV